MLAATTLTGFLSDPTEQVAVPGMSASGELTPEGDLYTGWAEYELRIGSKLRTWDQPTRTLPDPKLPLLSSSVLEGTLRYTNRVFAIPVAGRPIAYETVTIANRSATPQKTRVELAIAYTKGRQVEGAFHRLTGIYRYERPVTATSLGGYEQLGQAFSTSFAYSVSGRDLDRSGLLLARSPAETGEPVLSPTASSSQTALHDGLVYKLTLPAHTHISLTWQIPLRPSATAEANRKLAHVPLRLALHKLASSWQDEEAGMMQISLPEKRVSAAYDAALVEILQSRTETSSGWMQTPNRLDYQAFWIRDAALEAQALDLAGLHLQAAEDLAFFSAFQQPDGLFISQAGQYDELGQAIWAIGEHALLTQSPAYASVELPSLTAAVDWLASASEANPLGLLPPSEPDDDELVYGYITGDDLWAADGLRAAVATAALAGEQSLAEEWHLLDERFEASLTQQIEAAVARVGHIPPALDTEGGQDWGNYGAAFPDEILEPDSQAVQSTLAWAREHSLEGLPTYNEGKELHDYIGFRLFETELEGGDQLAAVEGLYAELDHTTASDGGWELLAAPFGRRSSASDLAPHGTFAAEYIALLRNMLVREVEADDGVTLLSGASPAWLSEGQRISVQNADTDLGHISFSERSSSSGETLSWSDDFHTGATLTWTLPSWAKDVHLVDGGQASGDASLHGGEVLLDRDSGSVTVDFAGRRPKLSYANSVASLDAYYRAHGQAAPLVPTQ